MNENRRISRVRFLAGADESVLNRSVLVLASINLQIDTVTLHNYNCKCKKIVFSI